MKWCVFLSPRGQQSRVWSTISGSLKGLTSAEHHTLLGAPPHHHHHTHTHTDFPHFPVPQWCVTHPRVGVPTSSVLIGHHPIDGSVPLDVRNLCVYNVCVCVCEFNTVEPSPAPLLQPCVCVCVLREDCV